MSAEVTRPAAPLDAADLDVNRWIDQAVAAGMDPIVLVGTDGERSTGTKCVDLDHDLVPCRYLTDSAQLAICDGLEARGRVEYIGGPVVKLTKD